MATTPELPLEIWFQILDQTLNMLLPLSMSPRQYTTHIMPLLLTSHLFYEYCQPITSSHLRKHRLLQLFARWKAAHSREVHFYHHPLRTNVRYALPDRIGNPPGDEYENLYSFIKRSYLFGCESVCGTVIPVEGGLDGAGLSTAPPPPPPLPLPTGAAAATAPAAATANETHGQGTPDATAASNAGDGGGQGWKGHALQWHVANPTFAAEGTIELYRDVVEEYRRMICGSAAYREERNRELVEQTLAALDRAKQSPAQGLSGQQLQLQQLSERTRSSMTRPVPSMSNFEDEEEGDEGDDDQDLLDNEDYDEDGLEDGDDEDEEDEDEDEDSEEIEDADIEEFDLVDADEELRSKIEAKGGLRRRDSGHGQSSSEMDLDPEENEEMEANFVDDGAEEVPEEESDRMSGIQYSKTANEFRQRFGLTRKNRSPSTHGKEGKQEAEEGDQEQTIMDMALDKPYRISPGLRPLHPLDLTDKSTPGSASAASSSSSSSSSSSESSTSGSSRRVRRSTCVARRRLQRSHSSPALSSIPNTIRHKTSRRTMAANLTTSPPSSSSSSTSTSSPTRPQSNEEVLQQDTEAD
ncbi:hypothetical protein BGW38_006171, partial [Lunasporangiospora selenospora]